jgi:hypothetical protein
METDTSSQAQQLAATTARIAELELVGRIYRAGITDEEFAGILARGLVGSDEAKIAKMIEQARPKAAAPVAQAQPVVTIAAPGAVSDELPTDPKLYKQRGLAVLEKLAKG